MKKTALKLALAAAMACILIPAAWSQDFQKTYPLPAGGTISVANVSGNISVTGYNGTGVQVTAYKEGRDKNVVEVTDQSTANKIALGVQYPKDGGHYEASVRFVLEVPIGTNYVFDSLATASGDVKVSTVSGDLRIKTASGDVSLEQISGTADVKTASGDLTIAKALGNIKAATASGDVKVHEASGTLNASTASGDVFVQMNRVEGNGDMRFSSASGDVTVQVPAQLNAQVDMATATGSLKTDFPLNVEDRKPSGHRATGQVGTGGMRLTISTATGDVKLIR